MNHIAKYLCLSMLALMPLCCLNVFAQDESKKQNRPVPSGATISKQTISIPAPTSAKANVLGTQAGWLQFDKCPVFALESIELPTQESGVIASLDISENDAVSENQILGKLDARVAELERSVSGLQVQVAVAESQDDSEIRLAEAFVEEAQLQADIYEEMANKGTAGATDLRQRQLGLAQAKVRLTQSKATKVQKELKAKLAQASMVLSQQKTDRFTLKSPLSGTVTHIHHHPGEWVQAGTSILQIIRLDELRIDCFVDLEQVDPTKLVGLPVKTVLQRGTHETLFAGKIASYDPEVSSLGKIRVHAIVQNHRMGEHWVLLPGMSVVMQLQKPQ